MYTYATNAAYRPAAWAANVNSFPWREAYQAFTATANPASPLNRQPLQDVVDRLQESVPEKHKSKLKRFVEFLGLALLVRTVYKAWKKHKASAETAPA